MDRISKRTIILGVIIVLAGLTLVAWLSLVNAKDNLADRKRDCVSRNEGRKDIEDTFILVLNLIDPDHSSELWVPEPGRPSIDMVIHEKLAPNNCDNLE